MDRYLLFPTKDYAVLLIRYRARRVGLEEVLDEGARQTKVPPFSEISPFPILPVHSRIENALVGNTRGTFLTALRQ